MRIYSNKLNPLNNKFVRYLQVISSITIKFSKHSSVAYRLILLYEWNCY